MRAKPTSYLFLHRATIALLPALLLAGCTPYDRTLTSLGIIYEGRGLPGICELGQTMGTIRGVRLVRYNEDKYNPWTVYRIDGTQVFLDAEGKGRRAYVRRIAVRFPVAADFVTDRGLVIPQGHYATVGQVEDVYGPVKQPFGTNINAQIVQVTQAIKTGIPYSFISPDGHSEYRHYPADGISFYSHAGMVHVCYIEPIYDRPVWTF